MAEEQVVVDSEVEIKPRCLLYDKVLGFEEAFVRPAPECWVCLDPNVRALTMVDEEVANTVRQAARCWNCQYFVLELKGIYSIARIFGQPPAQLPPEEKKEERKGEEYSLFEELARGEG